MFNKFKKEGSSTYDYLVVGLGNPGKKYETTRHNAGFLFVENMENELNFQTKKLKFHALIGDTKIENKKVLVMKPQTTMNNSGTAVKECAQFYKIPVENIIVVYDDISLDPGLLRIRRKGSAGGHNGIKNIISHLGTEQFARVRIGVGEKPAGWDLADYVLGRFSSEEEPLMREALADAARACEMFVMDELSAAMNLFNKKKN